MRFYQVFTIGLEQQLVTSTLAGPSGPMLFRFAIESMLEPAEPEWDVEYREMLQTLERVQRAVALERDVPSRIITELIHGLRQTYPERAIRVDSHMFICESEPEMVMWDSVEEIESEDGT
jgi:hypothetical protein